MNMKVLLVGVGTLLALSAGAMRTECPGKTVKVSSYGFVPEDSTEALKAALNSDAARVIIDRQATDWISGGVAITNGNKEIIFEDGVTVRAKKGALQNPRQRLFAVIRTENVTIRGEGRSGIVMNKPDYQDPKQYKRSEFRDCIQIWGSKNVTVQNLFLRSSGGDGVEVTLSDGVLLEDLICEDNHRQGNSINCCENFTARRCVFNTTKGTWPMCGCDLEPFQSTQKLTNILYEDCVFDGNGASGIDLHLSAINATSADISVTFRRCKARKNRFYGLQMYSSWSTSPVKGTVLFDACEFSDNGYCPIHISNQQTNGLKVKFKDCVFDSVGGSQPSSLQLDNGCVMANIDGLTFENCKLVTEGEKAPVKVTTATGFGVTGLAGDLKVVRDGREEKFDLAAFAAANPPHPELVGSFRALPVDYQKLTGKGGPLSKPATTPSLTGRFVFLQHAAEAGEYPILFRCKRIAAGGPAVSVRIRDRAGTDLGGFDLPEGEKDYKLTVGKDTLTRFEVDAGKNFAVTVTSAWAGQGVQCDDFVQFGPSGENFAHRGYFTVLGKAKNVRLEIQSQGRSPAIIRNGVGEKVDEFRDRCAHQVYTFKRSAATEENEVWSVDFAAPRTAFGYRVGGGAVSVMTTDPQAVLMFK